MVLPAQPCRKVAFHAVQEHHDRVQMNTVRDVPSSGGRKICDTWMPRTFWSKACPSCLSMVKAEFLPTTIFWVHREFVCFHPESHCPCGSEGVQKSVDAASWQYNRMDLCSSDRYRAKDSIRSTTDGDPTQNDLFS